LSYQSNIPKKIEVDHTVVVLERCTWRREGEDLAQDWTSSLRERSWNCSQGQGLEMGHILAREVLIHLAPCVDVLPSVFGSVEKLVMKAWLIHAEVPGTKSNVG